MEIVGFVPVCGSMKKYRRNGTYHRLKSITEVSDCSQCSNVGMLSSDVKMVEVVPKVQPKIRLSINLLKRFRDAYVEGMLCFAINIAHMNNGDICFVKKIHDDDVQYLTPSSKLGF